VRSCFFFSGVFVCREGGVADRRDGVHDFRDFHVGFAVVLDVLCDIGDDLGGEVRAEGLAHQRVVFIIIAERIPVFADAERAEIGCVEDSCFGVLHDSFSFRFRGVVVDLVRGSRPAVTPL
jgi:hypothetical protein